MGITCGELVCSDEEAAAGLEYDCVVRCLLPETCGGVKFGRGRCNVLRALTDDDEDPQGVYARAPVKGLLYFSQHLVHGWEGSLFL